MCVCVCVCVHVCVCVCVHILNVYFEFSETSEYRTLWGQQNSADSFFVEGFSSLEGLKCIVGIILGP